MWPLVVLMMLSVSSSTARENVIGQQRVDRSVPYSSVVNQSIVLDGSPCAALGSQLVIQGQLGPTTFSFLLVSGNVSLTCAATLTSVEGSGKYASFAIENCPLITELGVTGVCGPSGDGKSGQNMVFSPSAHDCHLTQVSLELSGAFFCDITVSSTAVASVTREITVTKGTVTVSNTVTVSKTVESLTSTASSTASQTLSVSGTSSDDSPSPTSSSSLAPLSLSWAATSLMNASKTCPRGSMIRVLPTQLIPLGELMCMGQHRCFVRALKAIIGPTASSSSSVVVISRLVHALWTFTSDDLMQGQSVGSVSVDVFALAVVLEEDVSVADEPTRPYNPSTTIFLYNSTLVLQLGIGSTAFVINSTTGILVSTVSDTQLSCNSSSISDLPLSHRVVQLSQSAVAIECPGSRVIVLSITIASDGQVDYTIVTTKGGDKIAASSLGRIPPFVSPLVTTNITLVYAATNEDGRVELVSWNPFTLVSQRAFVDCISLGCSTFNAATVRGFLLPNDATAVGFVFTEGGALIFSSAMTPSAVANINPKHPVDANVTGILVEPSLQLLVASSDGFLSIADSGGGDSGLDVVQWILPDLIASMHLVTNQIVTTTPCSMRIMLVTTSSTVIVCVNVSASTRATGQRRLISIEVSWSLSHEYGMTAGNSSEDAVASASFRPAFVTHDEQVDRSRGRSYSSIFASSKVQVSFQKSNEGVVSKPAFLFIDSEPVAALAVTPPLEISKAVTSPVGFVPSATLVSPFGEMAEWISLSFISSLNASIVASGGASSLPLQQLAVVAYADQVLDVSREWPAAASGSTASVATSNVSTVLVALCGFNALMNPKLCVYAPNEPSLATTAMTVDSVICAAGDTTNIVTFSHAQSLTLISFACNRQLVILSPTTSSSSTSPFELVSTVELPSNVVTSRSPPSSSSSGVSYLVSTFSNSSIYVGTDVDGSSLWMARLVGGGGTQAKNVVDVASAVMVQTWVDSDGIGRMNPINESCTTFHSLNNSIFLACNGTASAVLVSSLSDATVMALTGRQDGWLFSLASGADGYSAALLVQLQWRHASSQFQWCVFNVTDFAATGFVNESVATYCQTARPELSQIPIGREMIGGSISSTVAPAAGQIFFSYCINATTCFTEGVCVGSPSCSSSQAAGQEQFLLVHTLSAPPTGCVLESAVHASWGILLLVLPNCHIVASDIHSRQCLWSTMNINQLISNFRAPQQHRSQEETERTTARFALVPDSSLVLVNVVLATSTDPFGLYSLRNIMVDIRTGDVVADHGNFYKLPSDSLLAESTNATFWLSAAMALPMKLPMPQGSSSSSSSADDSSGSSEYISSSAALVFFSGAAISPIMKSNEEPSYAITLTAVTIPIFWLLDFSYSDGYNAFFGFLQNSTLVAAQAVFDVMQPIIGGLPASWRPWLSVFEWEPKIAFQLSSQQSPTILLNLSMIGFNVSGFINSTALIKLKNNLPSLSEDSGGNLLTTTWQLVALDLRHNPLLGGLLDFSRLPSSIQVLRASGTLIGGPLKLEQLAASASSLAVLDLAGLTVFAQLQDPLFIPNQMEELFLSGEFVKLAASQQISSSFLLHLPASLRVLSLTQTLLIGDLNLDFTTAANVSGWSLSALVISGTSTLQGSLGNVTAFQLPPQLERIDLNGNSLSGSLALHLCPLSGPVPIPPYFMSSGSRLAIVDVSKNNISDGLHLSDLCQDVRLVNVSSNTLMFGAVDGFATSPNHPLVIDLSWTSITEIVASSCPLPSPNMTNVTLVTGGDGIVCVPAASDQLSYVPLCDPQASIALYPFDDEVFVVHLNATVTEGNIGSLRKLPLYTFTTSRFDRSKLAFERSFLEAMALAIPLPPPLTTSDVSPPAVVVTIFGSGTQNASLRLSSLRNPEEVLYTFSAAACVAQGNVLLNASYCMTDSSNPQKNFILNLTGNATMMHIIDLSGLYPLEKDCIYNYPMLLLRNTSSKPSSGTGALVIMFPAWFMLNSSNMSYCIPVQPEYTSGLNSISSTTNDTTWNFGTRNAQPNGQEPSYSARTCIVTHPVEECRLLPVIPVPNNDETCYRELCAPSETVVWTACLGSGVHAGFARLGQCHALSNYFGPSLQPVLTQSVTQQCPTDVSSCSVSSSSTNGSLPECSRLAGRFSGLSACLLSSGYDPFSIISKNLAPYCNSTNSPRGSVLPCVGNESTQADVCAIVDVFDSPAAFEGLQVRAACVNHGESVILSECATGLPLFQFATGTCSGQYNFQCSPCLAYVDPLAHAQPLVFLFASSIKDILLILFGATILSKPSIRRRTTKWLVNVYVSMLPYYKGEREDWTRKWFVRLNPKLVAESDFVWVYSALMQGKQLRRSTRSRKQKRKKRVEAAAAAAGGGGGDWKTKKVSGMDVMRGYDVPLLFETEDDYVLPPPAGTLSSHLALESGLDKAINDEVLSSHEADPFFAYYIEHLTENRSQIVIETTSELLELFQKLRDAFNAHYEFMQKLSPEQRRLIIQKGLGRSTDSSSRLVVSTTSQQDIDEDDEDDDDEGNSDYGGARKTKSSNHLHQDLAVTEMHLWLAVKKAKDAFLAIAGLECVILEKASLDNKFTPQAWMLTLQLLYAVIFLLICIVESGKVTYTAWTTYEAVYFRFINSSTSVGLLTNSILRRFYRFDGKHYVDFFVVASAIILFPPFVTHTIPGLILYFWLTVGVAVLVFAAVQTRKVLATQTWFHQQSYRSVAYRITLRFFLTAVLTFVLQMGFNYAVLFYKRDTFQLTYFEVVSWEYESRGLHCFLIDAFETLTNTLQLFSIAS